MSGAKKFWLIAGSALVIIGFLMFGGIMTVLGWDFTKISTSKFKTNAYDISEEYKNIQIYTETASVVFLPSQDAKTSVVIYEQTNVEHSVEVKDGILSIKMIDMRKWYQHIGTNLSSPKITVYLPSEEYGALSVECTTGDISLEGVMADNIELSLSTGKISLSAIRCNELKFNVSTGRSVLDDVQCKALFSEGTTGNVSLNSVIVEENLSIKRTTGSIEFLNCDAGELFIKTTTGDVKGCLLTEKIFITHTSTGQINLPPTRGGGKCEITTSTGNITVELK